MDFGTFVRRALHPLPQGAHLVPGGVGELPVAIASAGWELQNRPGYDWHGLRRTTPEHLGLQLTMHGQGSLTYEGRTMPVPAGTLMVVPMPHDHRYWLPEGGSWEFLFLGLRGREAMRAGRQLIARRGPVIPLTTASPSLTLLINACRHVMTQALDSPYQGSAVAWTLLMSLLGELAHGPRTAPPPGIERVLAHVRARYQDDLSASGLAQLSGFSRGHFTKLFQEAMGTSPGVFISTVRVQVAMRLLREGQSVSATGRACGFQDSAYFCRVFRRILGVSPGAFARGRLY